MKSTGVVWIKVSDKVIPQERITLAFDSASKVCRSGYAPANQYPVGRRGIPFVALSCFFNIVTITRTITAWTVMQLIQTLK
jgi:hypothetical protein